MGRAIGIDLGTTNSCAAVVIDGTPTVITYPGGFKTIPSVFAIDKSGQRLTGQEALAQQQQNPDQTIAASKRLLGRAFGSNAVQKMSQLFTYDIVEGDESEVLVQMSGQLLTLEQISAALLARIKVNATEFLGEPVDQAVITIPAYFNERQRQAVRAAGRLAGFHVLRVLNEPTAAALAYGMGRKLNQRIAIYDLGGGTFDISVIDIKDRLFNVIANGGDTFLGGLDFDSKIMNHLMEWFYEENGVDLSFDRQAVVRLRQAAEQAKIALSSQDQFDITLKNIYTSEEEDEQYDLNYRLTREELEKLTRSLVKRTLRTFNKVLQVDACADGKPLGELLLVGGQSRMPLVRTMLSEYLGRPLSEAVQPEEAVALGAAIMANSLQRSDLPDMESVTLKDVLPMNISMERPNGSLYPLFKRGTALPHENKRLFTTSDPNQDSLSLTLFQGDGATAAECELLGRFVIQGLRNGNAGEIRTNVHFHIDSEGLLQVTSTDYDTGAELTVHMHLDSSAPEQAVHDLEMPMSTALGELEEVDVEPISQEPEAPVVPEEPAEPPAERGSLQSLRSSVSAQPKTETQESKSVGSKVSGWFKGLFGKR